MYVNARTFAKRARPKTDLFAVYNNLPHPPDDFVGQVVSVLPPPDGFEFLHRSADGSRYPSEHSTLGMARTAYARSVPPLADENMHDLPRPSEVFDRLLKRDKYVEHPGGISSLFFAFANLVIHSVFSTDQSPGYLRNNVSSYLDLSPLYGSSQAEQNSVRRRDGTGKLIDDCFTDARLLLMPPSTGALLVMFNRNHNVGCTVRHTRQVSYALCPVHRRADPRHQRRRLVLEPPANGPRPARVPGGENIPDGPACELWVLHAGYPR
jgi:hypothetical protein